MQLVFHTVGGFIHLAQVEQKQRGIAVQHLQRHAALLFGGKAFHRAVAERARQRRLFQAHRHDICLCQNDAVRQCSVHKAAPGAHLHGWGVHQNQHVPVFRVDAASLLFVQRRAHQVCVNVQLRAHRSNFFFRGGAQIHPRAGADLLAFMQPPLLRLINRNHQPFLSAPKHGAKGQLWPPRTVNSAM